MRPAAVRRPVVDGDPAPAARRAPRGDAGCGRPGGGQPPDAGRAAARAAVGAAGAAGDGLAARRAAAAARGRFTPVLDAGGVGAAGGAARRTSACAGSPAGGRAPCGAGAGAGAHALVGRRRGDRGGGRVRRPSADLSLPADHRGARPSVLLSSSRTGSPTTGRCRSRRRGRRSAARHQPAPLRQPRLLPGRRERGAAVHGRAADGRGGRVLGRRGGRGGPACRRCSGPARCSPSAAWPPGSTGPRWAPLAALVLALSLPEQFTSRSSLQRAAGADPVPRRAVPGHRLAGGTKAGRPGCWRRSAAWRSASPCWCASTGRATSCR